MNTGNSRVLWSNRLGVGLLGAFLLTSSGLQAAELKKETLKNWNDYIQESNSRMQGRLRPDGQFLWVDELPERGSGWSCRRRRRLNFPLPKRQGVRKNWNVVALQRKWNPCS